ncbi:MAG: protein-L-isoaspartate O-methyltransferase family protein [Pseudonocardiaceae bacterium]
MTPEDRRQSMVAALVKTGRLTPTWRPAFEQVARHLFIPDTIWRLDRAADGRLLPLHRGTDPEHWLECAYADAPVDTQVDDGQPADDGTGFEVTSSASQPSVVADMLAALDAQPGLRVLEIGTATGWNAALLAHRVGAENVTSIEIDPAIAEQARIALGRAGFGTVTVHTGDGAEGDRDGGPYHRVIATVGVSAVPYSWIAQTVPGGRVVVPLTNTYQPPGIVALTVHNDGTASGRLATPAAFMALRAQRIPRPHADFIGEPEHTCQTQLHPWRLVGDRNAATAIGQRLGDGIHTHYEETENTGVEWLLDPTTRSWASIEVAPQPPYEVSQGGPRQLFDEVAGAYQWWCDAGEPVVGTWLVTVGPAGQHIELKPAEA